MKISMTRKKPPKIPHSDSFLQLIIPVRHIEHETDTLLSLSPDKEKKKEFMKWLTLAFQRKGDRFKVSDRDGFRFREKDFMV